MKILLTLILLIPLTCRAKIELNCETLADYYVEYAKPKNAPSKDMLSSRYYMGLVWGFLNGDSRRSYRPPKDVTMSQASHAVGDWLTSSSTLPEASRLVRPLRSLRDMASQLKKYVVCGRK